MNRILSLVLLPLVSLALVIPVGCNKQVPTSSVTNNTVAPATSTTNSPFPQRPFKAFTKADPSSNYYSATGSTDGSVSYTRTQAFYPYLLNYEYYYYAASIRGLAMLPNGNLVLSDYDNYQIDEVTSQNNSNDFGYTYANGFGYDYVWAPYGLAADSQGNVNVANYYYGDIVRFNSSGTYIGEEYPGIGDVTNVAVDGSGNYYVVGSEGIVSKYNSGYGYEMSFGRFDCPYGLAVNQDGVFIGDECTDKVYKYSLSGKLIGTVGDISGKGKVFEELAGLAADNQHDLFIADVEQGIFKFNSITFTYQSTVANINEFYDGPGAITTDGQGNLFAADVEYYIYKFVPKP